jgi:outer membrane receptor protein involved in Fe transport
LLVSAALLTCGSAAFAQNPPAPPTGQAANATKDGEAIIVTAQRRVQTLIEVPQSVSVIGGEKLEQQQAKSFLDYSKLVPGFYVTQNNPGQSRLILRGINTGSVGSTVAVYVDDIPYGASGSLSNSAILAGDFDTFDINRVEVLRGPQGTLYGSNSLGGVLKYITALPSTDRIQVRGQAGFEAVKGGDLGPLFNVMANVPLGDKVAVRASGYYKKTPGYVDVAGRSGKNVDDSASYGLRGSLLFKPTEDLSIRLFALAQDIHADSPSTFTADPATLQPVNPLTAQFSGHQRTRFELIPEKHDINYRVYSGTLDYDFGFAALTSISSYATQKQDQFLDISTNNARGLANLLYALTAPNTVGLGFRNNVSVKKFTQEVRLVSPKSTFFDWVAGVYYTHEDTGLDQEFLPFTISNQGLIPPATTVPAFFGPPFGGNVITHFVTAAIDAKYKEIAGYVNGTFHWGEHFDLNLGGRYSHNKQSSLQSVIQLGVGSPQSGSSSQGVFTWNISPRYEFNKNTAIYARVAKGYRPGGPNFVPPFATSSFPTEFEADTLISYEAGLKMQSNDGVFALDASGFYVDWKNILINSSVVVNGTPVGINANGGKARTYGAEGTLTLRPAVGLDLVANFAWTNARLIDPTTAGGPNDPAGGLAGERLPYIPNLSGTLSADYRWDVSDRVRAYVGGDIHSQSSQKAGFSNLYRIDFGRQINLRGYTTVDLRAGIDFKPFTVQAYVRNLLDSNGLVGAEGYRYVIPVGLGGSARNMILATTIRPRTFGLVVGAEY